MSATQPHPGAFLLDDIRLYALDTLQRTAVLTDHFSTTDSTSPWRSSFLPGDSFRTSMIENKGSNKVVRHLEKPKKL
jgi:hypothetical protein